MPSTIIVGTLVIRYMRACPFACWTRLYTLNESRTLRNRFTSTPPTSRKNRARRGGLAQVDAVQVERLEQRIVHLVHHAQDFGTEIDLREVFPGGAEHSGHAPEIHVFRLLRLPILEQGLEIEAMHARVGKDLDDLDVIGVFGFHRNRQQVVVHPRLERLAPPPAGRLRRQ